MGRMSSTWSRGMVAVLKKDLRSEFRTRYTLSTLGMFSLTTLMVVSFTVGAHGVEGALHGALLWMIIFFAAMAGLPRSFVKEEEAGTGLALRLTGNLEAIYFGKLLFNVVMLTILIILLGPLYLFFMSPPVPHLFSFALVLWLGVIGIAGITTILSALVAKAASRGTLLPVLAFPVLLPVLITSISATGLLFEGAGIGDVSSDILFTISYSGLIITVSYLLFGFVWEE